MKLATYLPAGRREPRIGIYLEHAGGAYLVDAVRAYTQVLSQVDREPGAAATATALITHDMKTLLAGGATAMAACQRAFDQIRHWLGRGAGGVQQLLECGVLHGRGSVTLLAPIPRPGKVVAIGANYRAHIEEGRDTGAITELPSYPPAFLKMSTAVVGSDQPIVYPGFGHELDYEVELSMVVGRNCRDVAAEDWLDCVAGFTIVNDLSMRDVILEEKASGIVFAGKNFESACPMGPFLVTRDEIADPGNLRIGLRVNGQVRQSDSTRSMLFSCGQIFAYWSRLGLECGDVITTGTPGGGAGFHRRFPERLLQVGDVVEAEIEGLGTLRNQVVKADAHPRF